MKQISGKVALITGGASGIGLGMAQAFAAAEMRIVIADVDEAALAKAEASLLEQGAEAMSVVLDVADADAWAAAVSAVNARFGSVDVLCNNAGVGQGRLPNKAPLEIVSISDQLWRMVFDVNVTGAFLGVKAVAPSMIERGQGYIVNTASMAGFIAPPGLGAYAASKYALVGLSESLRAELEPKGVGVAVLCPGGVKSNLVSTTAAQRAARLGDGQGPEASLVAVRPPSSGETMEARSVGERVLTAIRNDEFYILTHPDYGPLMQEHFDAVMAAVDDSAQAGYREPPEILQRSRNPVYARLAKSRADNS